MKKRPKKMPCEVLIQFSAGDIDRIHRKEGIRIEPNKVYKATLQNISTDMSVALLRLEYNDIYVHESSIRNMFRAREYDSFQMEQEFVTENTEEIEEIH